jgi:hypothetical protein
VLFLAVNSYDLSKLPTLPLLMRIPVRSFLLPVNSLSLSLSRYNAHTHRARVRAVTPDQAGGGAPLSLVVGPTAAAPLTSLTVGSTAAAPLAGLLFSFTSSARGVQDELIRRVDLGLVATLPTPAAPLSDLAGARRAPPTMPLSVAIPLLPFADASCCCPNYSRYRSPSSFLLKFSISSKLVMPLVRRVELGCACVQVP